jgi:hypothetical protein
VDFIFKQPYSNYELYYWNGTAYALSTTHINGDGYLVDGHLWVWNGNIWDDVGVIQGPAGTSSFLYIRCSDDEGIIKTLKNEGETGKYIGYLLSSESLTETELIEKRAKFT